MVWQYWKLVSKIPDHQVLVSGKAVEADSVRKKDLDPRNR